MSNDTRPEIRFPGFTEDWEERKLGDVSNYSNGGSYESDVENRGKYELITLKSVDMFGNLVSSGKFINKKVPTLNKGTLVMILSEQSPGLLGMTAQIPKDDTFVLNQRVAEIHPNDDTNGYFLSMAINRSQAYFSKRGAGTKVQNISKSNVENFEFFIPIKHEQQKIGTFFKNLDDTITLHQRKLDLLKETKKGFLQKMFPKNGAKVPEIRFPGFTEDWEQRKLGEIVRISSGFTGDSSLSTGQYEVTRIETIATGQVNPNKVGYSNTEPDKKYLLDKGDILFSNINSLSHIGKIALFDLDMKLYHGINLLRLQPMNVNSQFLYQSFQLNNHLEWAKSHANQAVSQASINQTELSKQVFLVPSQQEQQKIGTFFKQLDDTIALHQRKLDLLKETKKGFLQKMFV